MNSWNRPTVEELDVRMTAGGFLRHVHETWYHPWGAGQGGNGNQGGDTSGGNTSSGTDQNGDGFASNES